MMRQTVTVMATQVKREHACGRTSRIIQADKPLRWLNANGEVVEVQKHLCTVCGKINLK